MERGRSGRCVGASTPGGFSGGGDGDRLRGDLHAVRGSESRAAVMESSPALPFPQSRGKSVDKVGGGVYNVASSESR
jgi:hypothetical protein